MRPELEAPSGWIYFIEADQGNDLYKIGVTENLERRMKELRPRYILAKANVPNPKVLETELHSLFQCYRLPGTEYFVLEPEDVLRIQDRIQPRTCIPSSFKQDGLEAAAKIETLQEEMDHLNRQLSLEESPIRSAMLGREFDHLLAQHDQLYNNLLRHASSGEDYALTAIELLAKAQDQKNFRESDIQLNSLSGISDQIRRKEELDRSQFNRYRADLERITNSLINDQSDNCKQINYEGPIEEEVVHDGLELAAEWERMYLRQKRIWDQQSEERTGNNSVIRLAQLQKESHQVDDRLKELYQLIAKEARAGRTEAFNLLNQAYGMTI
ncbi:MAG: GIY-YIG nuclease family protein [Cyanobium sp. M30B3]|nr:MAG: GIY-YIG nuclease family protein [Cyanobium sp. M30B3]